jgi:hypothetical protein
MKRSGYMQRWGRGLQMLRLGKRTLPMLRMGRSSYYPGYPDDDWTLDELLDALENEEYNNNGLYYYPEDQEPMHGRFRRSAELPEEGVADDSMQDGFPDVKRSSGLEPQEGGAEDGQLFEEGIEKRPMNMLRLGKRPMNMLRLGKRPMNMLRLGKRPMNMLRLGKRPMNMLRLGKKDSSPADEEEFGVEGDGEWEELDDGLSADKRPMNMLRLGKRPMNMLRLGKRPMNMLRLGKRPMNMLRLGKRPMNMLRLGKRDAE